MTSTHFQFGYVELGQHQGSDEILARRRRLVETLWSVRIPQPQDFLVLPDGRSDLIIRFKLNPTSKPPNSIRKIEPVIVGPSTFALNVPIDADDGFLGVRLKPEQAKILKQPSDLVDTLISGQEARELLPVLNALPDEACDFEALLTLFRLLLNQMPESEVNPETARAVDLIHLSGGRISVSELSHTLGVGERQLHRLFLRHVGLSTKVYADVIRFQRAVRLCRKGVSIGQCAFEAGYSDQAHMSRAFRKHGGFTPARMPDFSLGSIPTG
ncbi:MAG: AraC family transcriptional regulator [Pseudomonadota bacterium]